MENKKNFTKVMGLMVALCIFLNVYANANTTEQSKEKTKTEMFGKMPGNIKDSKTLVDTVATPKERAYNLFKDKILLEYLYDNRCDNNTKMYRRTTMVPVWHRGTGDKCYESVINYGALSADKGTENAKMFWSMIKETVAHRQSNEVTDSANTFVSSYIDENMDTVITTYIFGGEYIDFNDAYVAKYIKDIEQICADEKLIKEAELKKSAVQQKMIENTQSK